MRVFSIKKKSGGERKIYAPNNAEKARLRLLVPDLNERVLSECDPDVVHGFCPGRSPVTNAARHVGFKWTLNADISNFFDNVMQTQCSDIPNFCFPDYAARQGLPTSPAISNLALIGMDGDLKKLAIDSGAVYTRYADDLTFSGNDHATILRLRDEIPGIVLNHGFTLNIKKTRIQDARFGRREITGVRVDETGIYVSRKTRRKLRAARHNKNKHQARGLAEWSKLKPPNPSGSPRISRVKKTMVRAVTRRIKGLKNIWD